MARTYSHTHDPHHAFEADTIKGFTPEEVDAAVAKGGTLPDVTVADAGKFLRVNNDGKLNMAEYPIETQVNVVYSGDVTTTESPETVSVVEFTGTTEDFSQLNVVVNNETLVYNSSYNSFDDVNETISILLADGYIKLFAYNANTFAVEIKQINEVIDEEFNDGVLLLINENKTPLYNHIIALNNGCYLSVVTSGANPFTTASLAAALNYSGIIATNPIRLILVTALSETSVGSGVLHQYQYGNFYADNLTLKQERQENIIQIVNGGLTTTLQQSTILNPTVFADRVIRIE